MKQFNYIKICDKKWVKANDLSSGQHSVYKTITFKKSMPRSDLRGCSDAYIVVKRTIDLLAAAAAATNENNKVEKMLHLKIIIHLDHSFQMLTVH